jgi:di/tricarboxylate transporter
MIEKRKWPLKIVIVLLTIFIVLLSITIYELKQVSDQLIAGLCDVTIERILPAPDAKMTLISYVVGCGATTPLSTQLSLLPSGARFSREAYPSFFRIKSKQDLMVRWIDNMSVEVAIPSVAEVYERQSSANGIMIKYK